MTSFRTSYLRLLALRTAPPLSHPTVSKNCVIVLPLAPKPAAKQRTICKHIPNAIQLYSKLSYWRFQLSNILPVDLSRQIASLKANEKNLPPPPLSLPTMTPSEIYDRHAMAASSSPRLGPNVRNSTPFCSLSTIHNLHAIFI